MSAVEGDLRVAYTPQVPMPAYIVPIVRLEGSSDASYLQKAKEVLDAIVGLSIFEFETNVKPDYSDMAAIERFEDGGWAWVEESEYETD